MKLYPLSDVKVIGVVCDMFTNATAIIPSKPITISIAIQTTDSRIILCHFENRSGVGVPGFQPENGTLTCRGIMAGDF